MNRCSTALGVATLLLSMATVSADPGKTQPFPQPLPNDTAMRVDTLPAVYPPGWAFLAYGNGNFEIRDVGSDDRSVKGILPGHESGTLLVGTRRPELYVADTAWARSNRGTRTDYISIYDKQTLQLSGEIVLPGARRALVVPMHGMFSFADDERLALVYNFTPAASVTIVDLVQRKVLNEISIPGCSLAYSSGSRGFASLCGSGTLLSIQIDSRGRVARKTESAPFNPLDTDPLFTESAVVQGIRYFPSFHGRVRPLDLRADEPKVLPDWPLVSAADAAANWRPSGQQLVAGGDDARLYVIMQPDAHEGTHKKAGSEVWVFDTTTQQRVDRLRLVRPGTSIQVTHTPQPVLLVATGTQLDVYELPRGMLVRSLDAEAQRGGMLLETVR
jgi:methylamine dehydrogenase heavy chain